MNQLALRVREERKNRALTQLEFAAAVGLNAITISNIENGKKVGFKVIKSLAKELKLDTSEIRELMLAEVTDENN